MTHVEKDKLNHAEEHRPKSMLGHLFENYSAYFFADIQDLMWMSIGVFNRLSLELVSYENY